MCAVYFMLGTMAMWTSLSLVEDTRVSRKIGLFPRCLVFGLNWNAHNEFPCKFFYLCCPHRHYSGLIYGKSLEFGPKYDHDMEGEPFFRFNLVMYDAIHGGPPMTTQLWETTNILLKCSTTQFAKLSFIDQVLKV